jgi:hypothetical protein
MAISENIILEARNKTKAAFDQLAKDAKTSASTVSSSMNSISGGAKTANTSISGLIGSLGNTVGAIGAVSIAGITLSKVISSISQFTNMAVAEAGEAEQIGAQVEAVLQSTGYAAGITTKEIQGYADELGMAVRVEDDLIARGEALLLTYTQVGKEVFKDTAKAALNMTAVLNQGEITAGGYQTSIMMLGKALSSPAEGFTALKRAGIIFTESQEQTIKTMAESGDMMGAQRMILDELEKKFGSAAETIGNTYVGSVNAATIATKDLGETIATPLLPLLTAYNNDMTALKQGLAEWIEKNLILYPQQQDLVSTTKDLVGEINSGEISVEGLTGAWLNNSKAADSAADAMKKAAEAITVAGLSAGVSGQMGSAFDDYTKTIGELKKEEAELTAELEKAARLGWSENSKKVTGLNSDLAANKTKQQEAAAAIRDTTKALIYQQAAAGLDADASLRLARSMGQLSERDYATAVAVQSLYQQFDKNSDKQLTAAEGAQDFVDIILAMDKAVSNLDMSKVPITVESLMQEISRMMQPEAVTSVIERFGSKAITGAAATNLSEVSAALAGTNANSIEKSANTAKTSVSSLFDGLQTSVADAKTTVQSLADMIANLPESKTITITTNIVTNYQTSYSTGGGGGGGGSPTQAYPVGGGNVAMAGGGAVYAGQPVVVGDPGSGGEEVFVPNANGYVLNRTQAQQALASGEGGYVDRRQIIYLYISDTRTAALAAALITKSRQDKFNDLMGG